MGGGDGDEGEENRVERQRRQRERRDMRETGAAVRESDLERQGQHCERQGQQ